MDYIEKRFSYTGADELNMYYCGKRVKTQNHSYGPQIRDHYLLVYIKEGDAILFLNKKHYNLCSGQLLCMFPNEKIYYTAKGSLWSNLWVGVYGTRSDSYIKSLGITREYPVYNCPNPNETEDAINRIIDSTQINNSYGKMNPLSALYSFFASLYNKTSERFSEVVADYDVHGTDTHEITYHSNNLYIREAENFIRFHYDSNISIKSLADSLNLSVEYFSRLFKVETGLTPREMIKNYRIEKACSLLANTNLSISEISNCIGIQDQRYFSKLFKKNIGCTPSLYRRN